MFRERKTLLDINLFPHQLRELRAQQRIIPTVSAKGERILKMTSVLEKGQKKTNHVILQFVPFWSTNIHHMAT